MKEIVLPSGRFAAVRSLTWADRMATFGIADFEKRVMTLAVRAVTIDGAPLTPQDAQDMELEEANPIIEAILCMLIAGHKSRGVA